MNITPEDLDQIGYALQDAGVHPDKINALIDNWQSTHPDPVQTYLSHRNDRFKPIPGERCEWRPGEFGFRVLTGIQSGYGYQFSHPGTPLDVVGPYAHHLLHDYD